MASDIKNVKLGVCSITFDGVDLGYTKGGVEVTVKTDTHVVNLDQFGKTPVNEFVMGRQVSVKAPLAETTLDNLVKTMPGATLVQVGAAAATGTITIASVPTTGQTITINGRTVTFKTKGTANPGANEVDLDTTAVLVADQLRKFINFTCTDAAIISVTAGGATAAVTLTADTKCFAGNSYTLVTGTAAAAVTMSAATMAGGLNGTGVARVDVPTGVNINLLDYAKVLVLRPYGKSDASEDFIIYRAATSGALNFAYKLEDERVFNVEFNGYPEGNNRLFGFGDPAAV